MSHVPEHHHHDDDDTAMDSGAMSPSDSQEAGGMPLIVEDVEVEMHDAPNISHQARGTGNRSNIKANPSRNYYNSAMSQRLKETPEIRERRHAALAVLNSRELLLFHAMANDESLPETRRRFTHYLIGVPHDAPPRTYMVHDLSDPRPFEVQAGLVPDPATGVRSGPGAAFGTGRELTQTQTPPLLQLQLQEQEHQGRFPSDDDYVYHPDYERFFVPSHRRQARQQQQQRQRAEEEARAGKDDDDDDDVGDENKNKIANRPHPVIDVIEINGGWENPGGVKPKGAHAASSGRKVAGRKIGV